MKAISVVLVLIGGLLAQACASEESQTQVCSRAEGAAGGAFLAFGVGSKVTAATGTVIFPLAPTTTALAPFVGLAVAPVGAAVGAANAQCRPKPYKPPKNVKFSCPKSEPSESLDGLPEEALLNVFPETLRVAATTEDSSPDAQVKGGCAFAGTWHYDSKIGGGQIDGTLIVQVADGKLQAVHGYSGHQASKKSELIRCPHQCCHVCYGRSSCRRGYYVEAHVEAGGHAALGSSYSPVHGVGNAQLYLSEDGEELDITFQTPGRYITARAKKVSAGQCGKTTPYIEEAARRAQPGAETVQVSRPPNEDYNER